MAVVELTDASLRFGSRTLWSELTLSVEAGEFLAVLGPNGAGKTTLLKVLLGLQELGSGRVTVDGRPPRRGSRTVGYVPQHTSFDRDLPLRGTDLVRLGLDGDRWGTGFPRRSTRERVARVVEEVGAQDYAGSPIGRLSGGEQQRLRIAQALVADPRLLLCDEPLLTLDLHHQQAVSGLIDERRRATGAAVLFVTHEINPVLPLVDRVLYLVAGRWAVGTPDEVMTSERLSDLYDTRVDVLRVQDRIVVVGTPEDELAAGSHHHHHHAGTP